MSPAPGVWNRGQTSTNALQTKWWRHLYKFLSTLTSGKNLSLTQLHYQGTSICCSLGSNGKRDNWSHQTPDLSQIGGLLINKHYSSDTIWENFSGPNVIGARHEMWITWGTTSTTSHSHYRYWGRAFMRNKQAAVSDYFWQDALRPPSQQSCHFLWSGNHFSARHDFIMTVSNFQLIWSALLTARTWEIQTLSSHVGELKSPEPASSEHL